MSNYCLSDEDREKIKDFYGKLPHLRLRLSETGIADAMDLRLSIEYCLAPPCEDHPKSRIEAYEAFIAFETYLAKERGQVSVDARDKILAGLTLRAIELFSDWDSYWQPPFRLEREINREI
jgi:hypothetical protein